jgi:hypothetical protein
MTVPQVSRQNPEVSDQTCGMFNQSEYHEFIGISKKDF